MAGHVYVDGALSTLTAAIDDAVTSVAVANGALFGSTYPVIVTIWDRATYPNPNDDAGRERVAITNRSGNTLTVTRGYAGTTAQSHANGETVAVLLGAYELNDLETRVAAALPLAGGTLTGDVTLTDGEHIVLGTTSGSKLGTAAAQKLGLWGVTPVVQPAAAGQAAVTLSTADGAIGALTISDPPTQAEVTALRNACETLADDVIAVNVLATALRAALVAAGAIKGSA